MTNKNLYIHIPFCVQRCYYCDFASTVYNAELAENYMDALSVEFARRAFDLQPETIFIGGGTPTALPLNLLEELMDLIGLLDLSKLKEFTIEANPGTITMPKLLLLKNSGITRVSLGVQSFEERGLKILGRFHTAKQSRFAIAQLHEAGFDNISADLIFAWPSQSVGEWQSDLERILQLRIPHVSCYSLSYPQGTELEKMLKNGDIIKAKEEHELELFNLTREILEETGLMRYEISNYAASGFECLHNIHYWEGGNYIGLGAGAHSYEESTRFGNHEYIKKYIESINESGSAISFVDEISPIARARECAAIWLRMTEGIDCRSYYKHTGYRIEELLEKEITMLSKEGLLVWSSDKNHLRLSEQAIPIADAILAEII